jgi:hypothetical protein
MLRLSYVGLIGTPFKLSVLRITRRAIKNDVLPSNDFSYTLPQLPLEHWESPRSSGTAFPHRSVIRMSGRKGQVGTVVTISSSKYLVLPTE